MLLFSAGLFVTPLPSPRYCAVPLYYPRAPKANKTIFTARSRNGYAEVLIRQSLWINLLKYVVSVLPVFATRVFQYAILTDILGLNDPHRTTHINNIIIKPLVSYKNE